MEKYYISSTKFSIHERQTKRGKVYDLIFRVITLDGLEKQKKLSGYQTKALAKQAYADFVTKNCEVVKDKPNKKKNGEKSRLKVTELLSQYIASLNNQNKESVIYDKIKIFDRFIIPYFESVYIDTVTVATLYAWQDNLWSLKNDKGNFYSYKYLDKIRGHFSAFFTWYSLRYEKDNPFNKVIKPKRRSPKTEMLFWTQEEFERFISVVTDKTYHCLFTFLFYTGRRKGEVLALSPNDIHADNITFDKSLSIRTLDGSRYKITSTKADKKQNLPIARAVKNEIAVYEGGKPFYFGGEKPIHPNTLARYFNRYITLAGVTRIRVHDLRHSFVSLLIHKGANLMIVADLIGDTVEQVTKTYGHLYNSDKIAIINSL